DDDDNNEDADAPRVAQWIDEEDLDAQSDDSEPEEDENEDSSEDEVHHAPFVGPSRSTMVLSTQQSLEDDLSALPLGMLRNAQRVLQAQDTSEDSGSESNEPSEEDTRRPISSSIKGKDKEIASRKSRNELAKRSNKHAPAEMSSKKPVTRKRTVVEIKSIQPRDPRFLPMTGEFATHKFRQQYGFLSDLHTTELRALRDNLKRARKLLVNSPHDLREEREEEVRRLELAVKRGESSVNRDKREKIEVEALGKIAKEEKERRKQGKAGWWLKGAEKKEVLVKARYEAIANAGGKRAVKKAIEKREKKINQKEKKSRPFARGQSDMKEDTRKRPARFNSGGDRHTKRRKVG
ncbi:hypothetical protein BJ138DRAFT_988671, partial [Hygrophoropsis aurantiaca]